MSETMPRRYPTLGLPLHHRPTGRDGIVIHTPDDAPVDEVRVQFDADGSRALVKLDDLDPVDGACSGCMFPHPDGAWCE